ncbi:MAG: CapA family protein, partial [Eggerthellaceae bacterium]|nr:CapA family protein [Eggerthellaceae bacterium]
SLENPRWYSRNENDVYVGGRRSFSGNSGERGGAYNRTAFHASGSYGRSKLPFIIGGGIIVLILLIVLIVNVIGALTAPQQAQQDDTLAVSEQAPTSTSLTISFAGDCTLGTDSSFDPSTSFNAVYNDADDPAYFMKNVASIFGSDDYTIVNMEGTLTESESRQDKTFAFKGPAEYTEILKSGNIEAASLANNHSHDYGDQSYDDTIAALDDAGIVNFGYDRIAYADVKGVKVAMIGTYMLAEGLDIKDEMVANINTAKNEGAQIIIVFTHWGIEKETVPGADQVELGHAAIDAGATIVVGSHPHVIQGYEKYNGRYIVYSLGNFCFGGNKNPSDKDCMIFQQTFTVTGNDVATDDSINVIPCSISSSSSSNNYQPTPAEGDEADRIMAKIEESNSSIASISAKVSGTTNDSENSESNSTDETSDNASNESNG